MIGISATNARHRDVGRLLRRLGLSADRPPTDAAAWASLLDDVSRAYEDADNQRYTLERSLAVSSQEDVRPAGHAQPPVPTTMR